MMKRSHIAYQCHYVYAVARVCEWHMSVIYIWDRFHEKGSNAYSLSREM